MNKQETPLFYTMPKYHHFLAVLTKFDIFYFNYLLKKKKRGSVDRGKLPTLIMRLSTLLYSFGFMVFNATFNNTSVISWQSVLLVEQTGVPGEKKSQR